MSHRPSDWSPLAVADPVPGDADEVEHLANEFRDTALEIEHQASVLRSLANARGWDSEAGDVFAEEAQELAKDLVKAHGRYAAVSLQLHKWAPALRDAQHEAGRALADARAAEAARRANRASVFDLTDDPTPEQRAADHRRRAAYEEATDALEAARKRLARAVGALDAKAGQVAHAIREASDDGVKDGFWDKVKGWVKDHAEYIHAIADLLSKIATVLAITAIILGGPLLWIAAGLTGLAFLGKAALAAAGEGTWLSAGLELLSLAVFFRGLRLVGRAKAAAEAARKSAAAIAGQQAATQVLNASRFTLRGARVISGLRIPLGPLRGIARRHIVDVGAKAHDASLRASREVMNKAVRRVSELQRLRHLDGDLAKASADVAKILTKYRSPEILANARRVQRAVKEFRGITAPDIALDLADWAGLVPGTKPHFSQVVGRCGGH